jgi:hypothetical protein
VSLLERTHEVTSFRNASQRQNLTERKRRGPDQLFRLTEPELSQKSSWTYTDLTSKEMSEMGNGQTNGSRKFCKINPASIIVRNDIDGTLDSWVTMPVLKACYEHCGLQLHWPVYTGLE